MKTDALIKLLLKGIKIFLSMLTIHSCQGVVKILCWGITHANAYTIRAKSRFSYLGNRTVIQENKSQIIFWGVWNCTTYFRGN